MSRLSPAIITERRDPARRLCWPLVFERSSLVSPIRTRLPRVVERSCFATESRWRQAYWWRRVSNLWLLFYGSAGPACPTSRSNWPHIGWRNWTASRQVLITGKEAAQDVHFNEHVVCRTGRPGLFSHNPIDGPVRAGCGWQNADSGCIGPTAADLHVNFGSDCLDWPTLLCTEKGAAGIGELRDKGVLVREVGEPGAPDGEFLVQSLRALVREGFHHVYCEGGSTVATALLNDRLVGEVHWYIAPSMGGAKLTSALGRLGDQSSELPLELKDVKHKILGRDLKVEGWLAD